MGLDFLSGRAAVFRDLARTVLMLAAGLVSTMAAAQPFPSKPIRFIVPYAPGGALDASLRLVGEQISASTGQPVLLEHKPGGSTTIAAVAVAQSPADGHTIFINALSYVTNTLLMSKLPYDPAKDFVPVSLTQSNAHVLVAPNTLGVKTFKDYVGLAKAKGKDLSFASIGNASSSHLGFELFKKAYGFDMLHVPYKGVPQAVIEITAGQVQGFLIDVPVVAPHIKAGKMAGLAIAADRRNPVLPEVPTFQEAGGTPLQSRSWFGMMVRAGTPDAVVQALHREVVKAYRAPAVMERLTSLGTDVIASTPAEFSAFMKNETERFAEAIRISGTKLE